MIESALVITISTRAAAGRLPGQVRADHRLGS